jgi:hypothetical protein
MKNYKIEIKWAFIFSTMFLLWMVMEKISGLHDTYLDKQQLISMLVLIPSIIIYVLLIKDKKKNYYAGKITYNQSFVSGLMLTVFVVLLSPINQLIISYIITPDYFANIIKHTVKSGMFTQEQAEAQFNIKSYMIISIAGGLVTGVIFSAIISIMNKPNKIDEFVSKLKHPMKAEIEEIIKIFRTSKELEEDVKWGGPSFDYKEPMATMNPRITDYVVFIFHKGELIKDKSGLLEPAPKGKAYLKFHSLKEIKDNKTNIQNIVKDWIKKMNT